MKHEPGRISNSVTMTIHKPLTFHQYLVASTLAALVSRPDQFYTGETAPLTALKVADEMMRIYREPEFKICAGCGERVEVGRFLERCPGSQAGVTHLEVDRD